MSQVVLQANLFDKKGVGNDAQYLDLINQINSARSIPSMSNSNDGCWRSDIRFNNIDWLLNSVAELVDASATLYSSIDPVFKSAVTSRKFHINYWTNINQPGARNVLHSHTSASLSCVYYVQGTGTGSLRILNPANILGDCNPKSPFVRDFTFTPSDRDLIMWPSWLPHEVEPNLSQRERINVVFDITFV